MNHYSEAIKIKLLLSFKTMSLGFELVSAIKQRKSKNSTAKHLTLLRYLNRMHRIHFFYSFSRVVYLFSTQPVVFSQLNSFQLIEKNKCAPAFSLIKNFNGKIYQKNIKLNSEKLLFKRLLYKKTEPKCVVKRSSYLHKTCDSGKKVTLRHTIRNEFSLENENMENAGKKTTYVYLSIISTFDPLYGKNAKNVLPCDLQVLFKHQKLHTKQKKYRLKEILISKNLFEKAGKFNTMAHICTGICMCCLWIFVSAALWLNRDVSYM